MQHPRHTVRQTNDAIPDICPQQYHGRGRHQRQSAPLTLPSGLDIQDDAMQLDNGPVRGSIQRVLRLAKEAPAPQRNIWSHYGALDAAQRQITGAAERAADARAYAQRLRRYMQEAHRQPQTGVITQGQMSKTASWMELTEAPQAQNGNTPRVTTRPDKQATTYKHTTPRNQPACQYINVPTRHTTA